MLSITVNLPRENAAGFRAAVAAYLKARDAGASEDEAFAAGLEAAEATGAELRPERLH